MAKSLLGQQHPLAIVDEQLQILRPSGTFPPFRKTIDPDGIQPLKSSAISVLQMNLGKLCNQTCKHCHVDAGPDRTEIMTRTTMEECLRVIQSQSIPKVDLTGGAPELNPHFRWLVEKLRSLKVHVIDRCNLTILQVRRFQDLPEFFASHRIEVIASLPSFSSRNTNSQRGDGVFEDSITAIKQLNGLGYGVEGSGLELHLVYNPTGAFLPARQSSLELEYRKQLSRRFGLTFNRLYVITNMPINRFLEYLLRTEQYERYMEELITQHNPTAVDSLMCRTTLSVGWDGRLFDCDFNQQLELGLSNDQPSKIGELVDRGIAEREIVTGLHCYGCTAGAGSSCGGEIVDSSEHL